MKNVSVTSVDFANQARLLSGNPKFRASTGWCRQFFIKYPEIKRLIRRKNAADYDRTYAAFVATTQMRNANRV